MDEATASELKARAHVTWAAGNFDDVAKLILPVGRELVERVDIREGEKVLDIAAGTGNASIPAALRGAEVTASDLTPELFVAGRANAEAAGVDIDWVEADAEALPFEDESFDVLLSTFGIMFAPRHEVAAAEAARVLRPGGRFGFCCWRPEGRIGEFFMTIGKHMPPPPDGFVPPPAWGVREHVTEIFDGTGIELEFEDAIARQVFPSADAAFELMSTRFGPLVMARAALEPQGKWEALRDDVLELYRRQAEPTDDGVAVNAEYLRTIGSKPA